MEVLSNLFSGNALTVAQSKDPQRDLRVNKQGVIVKRGFFSKVLYSLGYQTETSDRSLNKRVTEIVDQLLSGQTLTEGNNRETVLQDVENRLNQNPELNKHLMGLFLQKLGTLKADQFNRQSFVLNYLLGRKCCEFAKTIDQSTDVDSLKTMAHSFCRSCIQQINESTLSTEEKNQKINRFSKIQSSLAFLKDADLENVKNTVKEKIEEFSQFEQSPLARYTEQTYHLAEFRDLKKMFIDCLKRVEIETDLEKIRKDLRDTYDFAGSSLHRLFSSFPDGDCKRELDKMYQGLLERKNALRSGQDFSRFDLIGMLQYEILETKALSKVAKSQWIFDLGVTGQSEKGVTGTVLLKDYRNRILGVFKPDSSAASLRSKIRNCITARFGQLSLLSQKAYAQPTAEYMSYQVDRFFDFRAVPSSRLITLGGAKGVFQLGVASAKKTWDKENEASKMIAERLQEAKGVQSVLNMLHYKPEELEVFQRFILHDFLIGNLDAHLENWFVEVNSERKIQGIVGIDKANSWIENNPKREDWFTHHNQYKWGEFEIAKQPFTEEMRQFMGTITEDRLEAFFEKMEENNPGFFSESMKTLAKQRANAIGTLAKQEGSCPADFAKLISDADFAQLPRTSSQV